MQINSGVFGDLGKTRELAGQGGQREEGRTTPSKCLERECKGGRSVRTLATSERDSQARNPGRSLR